MQARPRFKLFFPTPPIDTPELRLHGIGWQERMPACLIDRPGGTGDYLLMLFYHRVRIGLYATDAAWCEPPTLMLWGRAQPHFYGNEAAGYAHTWIHIDGRWIGRTLRRLKLPVDQPILGADPQAMERCVDGLYEETNAPHPADATIVRNLIENWLLSAARRQRGHERAVVPENLLRVRRHIEAHFDRPLRLEELAKMAHLSPPYLVTRFRERFGVTPIEHALRLRLHKAAYLLRDRNLTVAQIAAAVGYEDAYHFSKLFKKRYGQSPTHLRRRLQG